MDRFFYIYVLRSLKDGKNYTDYMKNLKLRFDRVNSCDLFREKTNYECFLELYDKYISPVADTYAWVLMKNHFHLLVRIKEEAEIGFLSEKKYNPSHQFSHLFNAYAQAYNKRIGRTGSLFEHPFHRKEITDSDYFKTLVIYIHNNPVYPVKYF